MSESKIIKKTSKDGIYDLQLSSIIMNNKAFTSSIISVILSYFGFETDKNIEYIVEELLNDDCRCK